MESIIIKPRDKKEFDFFIELAKRLGVETKTIGDAMDSALLADMEKNNKTGYIAREEVLETIQNMLNDKKAGYK